MPSPHAEPAAHDRYLAEANAELDAMLADVGELESSPPPEPSPARNWARLFVVAIVAVVVFAVGMLLLRGRKPGRMTLHLR